MRLLSLLLSAVGMLAVATAVPAKRHGGGSQQPFTIPALESALDVLKTMDDQMIEETGGFLELWDDEGLVKRTIVSRRYPSEPRPAVYPTSPRTEAPQAKNKVPHTKPLGSVSDLSRCPSGLMACPIVPMTFLQSLEDFDADYEW